MKNINFIFSVIFLLWCFLVLYITNTDHEVTNIIFRHTLEEAEFNFFLQFLIFATFFNIFARIFNQCNFYLIGATGMIVLFFGQIFVAIYSITIIIITGFNNSYFDIGPNIVLTTLPYAVFGILSSICCYCNAINEKLDRNRTKFQTILLRFFPTDQQKIILIFNFSASISFLLFFIVVLRAQFDKHCVTYLLPFIPNGFNILAYYLKERKYYFGTMISWGIFGYYFGRILVLNVVDFFFKHEKPYQTTVNDILLLITLTSIVFINVFIGIISPISVYRKTGNQQSNEYVLEDQNSEDKKTQQLLDSEFNPCLP